MQSTENTCTAAGSGAAASRVRICFVLHERMHAAGMKRGLPIRWPLARTRGAPIRSLPLSALYHQKGPHPLPSASSLHPRTRRPCLAAALLATAVAGVLGGCGSSHSGSTAADPAGAVPASAPLYVGATVRPSGSLKTAALADGKALTQQANPYLRLVALLQTPGSPSLSFTRDVAPWLGPQAGLFLSSAGSSRAQSGLLLSLLEQGLLGSGSAAAFPFGGGAAGAQGAIVLDVTDAARARSFLASQARHAGAHAATYRGAAYQLTAGGVALGIVGHFAVLGSDSGLRGVIDTTKGGAALAHASGYSKLLASAPSGAIAHIHANPTAGGTAARGQSAAGLTQLLVGGHEANISLVPSHGSIALDADLLSAVSPGAPGGLLSAGIDGSQAFGELPGDSWLALGLGHVGATLGEDVRGCGRCSP